MDCNAILMPESGWFDQGGEITNLKTSTPIHYLGFISHKELDHIFDWMHWLPLPEAARLLRWTAMLSLCLSHVGWIKEVKSRIQSLTLVEQESYPLGFGGCQG